MNFNLGFCVIGLVEYKMCLGTSFPLWLIVYMGEGSNFLGV